MFEDTEFITHLIDREKKNIKNKFLQKSYLYFLKEVRFIDQDGDSFIRNIVVIQITGKLFKGSRIISKLFKKQA
jgi:hypothetical protein